jgi:hypothetical protein
MDQVVLQILKNVLFLAGYQSKRIKENVKELNSVSLLTKNLSIKSIAVLTLILRFLNNIYNSKATIQKRLKHTRKIY